MGTPLSRSARLVGGGILGTSAVLALVGTIAVQIDFVFKSGLHAVLGLLVALLLLGLGGFLARIGVAMDGTRSTILLAYPAVTSAICLTPVVFALTAVPAGARTFPLSTVLARWLLAGPLSVGGVGAFFRASFTLSGGAYVVMWFALSVLLGWLLGATVTGLRGWGTRLRRAVGARSE